MINKKILLIGKYPPIQGGISSKTYWLYERLAKSGFNFKAITVKPENYSLNKLKSDNLYYICEEKIPWHIPNSNLMFDRLLNKANEVIENFKPDIIETNYLWPFCSVALFIAQKLNKPLLIRHAGSDILKFYDNEEFKNIMKSYFKYASIIVTNSTCHELIKKICFDLQKIALMSRYIPDPDYFYDKKLSVKYDILFTSKINFFWKKKGIDFLLNIIKNNNLKALFIIDGNYLNEVKELIKKIGLSYNVKIIKFVHPELMPKYYNLCRSVWCWEEADCIDDFSNVIWEACFCNIPCFVNKENINKKEFDILDKLFPHMIKYYTPKDINKAKFTDIDVNYDFKKNTVITKKYSDYISQNINIYNNLK